MEDARRNGVSLGKLNLYMLIIAVIIGIILVVSMQKTQKLYKETNTITQNLVSWETSSYGMQLASDYLTNEMRNFAITGEMEHLNNYFEEVNVTKRREAALDVLEEQQGKTVAYQNLADAMEGSLELMNIEYYSARLVAEGYGIKGSELPVEIQQISLTDQDKKLTKQEMKEKGISLLYDDTYNNKKESISKHMNKCISDLNESMVEQQKESAAKLRKQVFGEHILIIILIAIMIGIVGLTFLLIIKPLKRSVELIRDEKEIPLKGAYEVQFLAKTYNLMYNTAHISNDHMTYESTHDKMTGLYNTHGYEFLTLNIDMETATLILLDLDNFSQVDHTFGKEIGNRVLIKAADTILKNFRAQDYICKLDNDEYAVIMIHTSERQKELISNKIDAINEKLRSHEDDIPTITLSAGVAFGAKGTGAHNINIVAKEALEEAKKKSAGICFMTAKG